jgi:hypothetical protein
MEGIVAKQASARHTDGLAVAIVDVDKDTIIKTLHFNSETGMPQYDSIARKVHVNLRRINQIAEINPATDSVAARYSVAGCEHHHGMAVDSEHHPAFLLCGGNRTFAEFALETLKAIAHFSAPCRSRRR